MFIDFGRMKTVNGRTTGEKNKVYKKMEKNTYPTLDTMVNQHSIFTPIHSETQKVQLDKDIENFENLVFYTIDGKVNSMSMNDSDKEDENEANTTEDEKREEQDISEEEEEEEERLQLNVDFPTHLYMGAATVVGLFVFYRMIQKTR